MDKTKLSQGHITPAGLVEHVLSQPVFVNHETHLVGCLVLAWVKQLDHADSARTALLWNGIKFHRFWVNAVRWFDGKECIAFIPAILCKSPLLSGVIGPRNAVDELSKIRGTITETIQLSHIGQYRSLRAVVFPEDEFVRDFLGPYA